MIVVNGTIVAQGSQFSLRDVEVVTATVDIEDVRTARSSPSRGLQANKQPAYSRLNLDVRLSHVNGNLKTAIAASAPVEPKFHLPEEEIALGPACWLWDYLRRSGAAGFFVPLSGGIDSCATAVIVFSMCREVVKAVAESNEQVIKDARRVCGEPEGSTWTPKEPQEVCKYVSTLGCFHCPLLTDKNKISVVSFIPRSWVRKTPARKPANEQNA